MTQKFKLIPAAAFAVLLPAFLVLALYTNTPAQAADNNVSNGITVDSSLDTPDDNVGDNICDDGDGNCTLRAAIEEANSNPDATTISFNISGAGVHTIQPIGGLPEIVTPTIIDGYSQPGSQANSTVSPDPLNGTLLIEIDGSLGGEFDSGLNIRGTSANSTTIKGLIINSFQFSGIGLLDGVSNISIEGNYIGVDSTGLIRKANYKQGIWASLDVNHENGPDNVMIGGLSPESRNVISGMGCPTCLDSQGIAAGGTNWTVQGNYIGVASDGVTAIGNNAAGMTIDYMYDLLVGGYQQGATNVISGNGQGGAGIIQGGLQPDYTDDVKIIGNFIGTDYTGTQDLGNYADGISYGFGSTNGEVVGNTIGFNGEGGVEVWGGSNNIHITSNSIKSNGGSAVKVSNDSNEVSIIDNSITDNSGIGIVLENESLTLINDPLDSDTGANDLLNFPLYTNIQEVSGDTTVDYFLDVPAGDYRIEFYSNTTPDPSGYGEGETFLGFQNVTSAGAGEQSFSHTLAGITGVSNLAMTTTEIDISTPSGFGATSAFGGEAPPRADISASITLNNPQDVAIGANLSYQIAYTNNGPEDAELSGFSTIIYGPSLLTILVPDDLINPSGYISDGPFPGMYFFDGGNADLSCLYAGAPGAAMFGFSADTSLGLVGCWFTGSDTVLESGSSVPLSLNIEVSPDSDLSFAMNAIAMPVAGDPEVLDIYAAFGSGDILAYLDTLQTTPNNLASASYPLPPEEVPDSESSTSTTGTITSANLASTGSNNTAYLLLATLVVTGSISVAVYVHLFSR